MIIPIPASAPITIPAVAPDDIPPCQEVIIIVNTAL